MTAGLLAVFSGYYAPYLPVTDTFSLYMLFGALFFLVVNRKPSIVNPFLLGLLAGLMHLSRADGILWLALALFAIIIQNPPRAPPFLRFTFYELRFAFWDTCWSCRPGWCGIWRYLVLLLRQVAVAPSG